MGTLINLRAPAPGPVCALPTVFTPERIERIGQSNRVSRQLRDLGYQIVAEDPFPNDDGLPVIQIDVGSVGTRPVQLLGNCTMRNTRSGIERTTIGNVRVFWRIGEA